MVYDVAIIGAGVIGAMTARELSRYRLKICMLERSNDVAAGASRANSGIVHGGYDPEPGTLKAEMNIRGVEKLFRAAEELHVPCIRNGSMICAFGAEEEPAVHELYERGLENGVKDLRVLSGDEARELEPELSDEVSLVLHVPTAGIICPYKLTIAAAGNAMDNGAELRRNFAVCEAKKDGDIFRLRAESGETVEARFVVNCAGAYSDRVAALFGDCDFTIIPRAGEYLLLDKAEGGRVRHTIFQVPSAAGKGILVSPTVDGNLLTGPTAAAVETPENTEITPEGIAIVKSLSARSVPGVMFSKVITSFSGVRASEKGGDFIIRTSDRVPGLVHAAAIDSPGLTSCVAIAERVTELLSGTGLVLEKNEDFNGNRPDTEAFRHMSDEEKDAFIRENPDYGRIICRCEGISEGEIRDAVRRAPGARDVDSVKRRTRAGMGRCQGGFCMPHVMRIIAEETGIPEEQVTKKGPGSHILTGRL